MLDRNKRIKSKPERFQNCKDKFDLVITCEERVYDQVLEGEATHNDFLITEGIELVTGSQILSMDIFTRFFSHPISHNTESRHVFKHVFYMQFQILLQHF